RAAFGQGAEVRDADRVAVDDDHGVAEEAEVHPRPAQADEHAVHRAAQAVVEAAERVTPRAVTEHPHAVADDEDAAANGAGVEVEAYRVDTLAAPPDQHHASAAVRQCLHVHLGQLEAVQANAQILEDAVGVDRNTPAPRRSHPLRSLCGRERQRALATGPTDRKLDLVARLQTEVAEQLLGSTQSVDR